MTNESIEHRLRECGCVLTNDHFVYRGWDHGDTYIDKCMIASNPHLVWDLGLAFFQQLQSSRHPRIDAFVAAGRGTVGITHMTAYCYNQHTGHKARSLWAEKSADGSSMRIDPDFVPLINGKNIMVIEDTLKKGKSVLEVVQLLRGLDGNVVAVAAIWNRGGVTAPDVGGVPSLFSLVNIQLPSWSFGDCPLCKQDIPINETVGYGREFVQRSRGL